MSFLQILSDTSGSRKGWSMRSPSPWNRKWTSFNKPLFAVVIDKLSSRILYAFVVGSLFWNRYFRSPFEKVFVVQFLPGVTSWKWAEHVCVCLLDVDQRRGVISFQKVPQCLRSSLPVSFPRRLGEILSTDLFLCQELHTLIVFRTEFINPLWHITQHVQTLPSSLKLRGATGTSPWLEPNVDQKKI